MGEIVLALSAEGLTTGEIEAHFDNVYGARVSKDTISRITEKVIAEMVECRTGPWTGSTRWSSSTLFTSRSATSRSRTARSYVAIGASTGGELYILGHWAGARGEVFGSPY